jgi:hypothetical protein
MNTALASFGRFAAALLLPAIIVTAGSAEEAASSTLLKLSPEAISATPAAGSVSRLGDIVATYNYRHLINWYEADGSARRTVRNGKYQVRSRGEWLVLQLQYEIPVTNPEGDPDVTEFNSAWVFRGGQLVGVVQATVWFEPPLANALEPPPTVAPFDLTDGWSYRLSPAQDSMDILDRFGAEAGIAERFGASPRQEGDRTIFESPTDRVFPTPFGTGRFRIEEKGSPTGTTLALVTGSIVVPQAEGDPLAVPQFETRVTRFVDDFPADVTSKAWNFGQALPGLVLLSDDTEGNRELVTKRRDEALADEIRLELVNMRRTESTDIVSMGDWQAVIDMVVPAGQLLGAGTHTRQYPEDGTPVRQVLVVNAGETGWVPVSGTP